MNSSFDSSGTSPPTGSDYTRTAGTQNSISSSSFPIYITLDKYICQYIMIYMDLFLTPFTLGQSTVITMPKRLGINPKMRIRAKKSGQRVVLEIIDRQTEIEKSVALVKKLAGGHRGKFNFTPDELNRRYEQGTYGHPFK